MSYFTFVNQESGGGGGGGDVSGPGSATDNAIARWDGTGGVTLQNSVVTISDAGAVSGVTTLSASSSVTAASLIPTGSTVPANGMYLSAANNVAFSTDTVKRGQIFSTGRWNIGNTTGGGSMLDVVNSQSTDVNSSGVYSGCYNTFNGAVATSSQGFFADLYRGITTSQTDTQSSLGVVTRHEWNVPAAQTLTHVGAVGTVADIRVSTSILGGGGSLAISNYAKMIVQADSIVTGARKYGLYIDTLSGATTANVSIADNITATSNHFIHSTSANPSLFSGVVKFPTGTSALPTIVFNGDETTGFYRPAIGAVGIAGSAVDMAQFSNSGSNVSLALQNKTTGRANISCGVTDGRLALTGSTGFDSGGAMVLYGSTHATQANDTEIKAGSTVVYTYDHSILSHLFTGDATFSQSIASSNGGIVANDTANSAITVASSSITTGLAKYTASVQSASTGDAFTRYLVSDLSSGWSIGLDNSDSDILKITDGSDPSTGSAYFQLTAAGALTLGASGGTQTHGINGTLQFTTGATAAANAISNTSNTITIRGGASGISLQATDGTVGLSIDNGNVNVSVNNAYATVRADVASAATITALSSAKSFVKLTGSTATTLEGITAGQDGQHLFLFNNSGQNLTIANEAAGATAANRIQTNTGADVVSTGNSGAHFIYDAGQSRWVLMSAQA